MATLYELNEQLANFELEIDEETGEILNGDQLDELTLAREEKIENIGLMIKNLSSEAAAIKVERDNLYKREKAAKSRAEWLTNYLNDMLQGETYKTPRVAITYRKSEGLMIEPNAVVPEEFLKFKDPEVDKVELKKAVKNGLSIDGIFIEERTNISVK